MKKKAAKSKFFHYSQNNSGGSFDHYKKAGITHHVVVEAMNAKDANNRAGDIGLYFNGCDTGMDCQCCGDRWSEQYDDRDGTKKPTVYGSDPSHHAKDHWFKQDAVAIHYMDGRIEWPLFVEKKETK